jgi:hypothetical protein
VIHAAWRVLSRVALADTLARGCSTALCLRKRRAMRVWWGAVAQLGERLVRNEEVSGSIPLSSTIESITCGMGIDASDTFVSLFVS